MVYEYSWIPYFRQEASRIWFQASYLTLKILINVVFHVLIPTCTYAFRKTYETTEYKYRGGIYGRVHPFPYFCDPYENGSRCYNSDLLYSL